MIDLRGGDEVVEKLADLLISVGYFGGEGLENNLLDLAAGCRGCVPGAEPVVPKGPSFPIGVD